MDHYLHIIIDYLFVHINFPFNKLNNNYETRYTYRKTKWKGTLGKKQREEEEEKHNKN